MAMKRLRAIEWSFESDLNYYKLYNDFVNYVTLGNITQVPSDQVHSCKYFLPHHGVLKESNTTTRLRVVFDESTKSTKGNSLNDILLVGSTVSSISVV